MVREILTRFDYEVKLSPIDPKTKKPRKIDPSKFFNIFGKDYKDNNILHHAYLVD